MPACLSPCPPGESCFDGVCHADKCEGVECPVTQLCSPLTGMCGADPCMGKCMAGQICDVLLTRCIDDPCRLVKCPDNTKCGRGGNCEAFHGEDGLERPTKPDTCGMGRGHDAGRGGGMLTGLLLAALGLLLARRRA